MLVTHVKCIKRLTVVVCKTTERYDIVDQFEIILFNLCEVLRLFFFCNAVGCSYIHNDKMAEA